MAYVGYQPAGPGTNIDRGQNPNPTPSFPSQGQTEQITQPGGATSTVFQPMSNPASGALGGPVDPQLQAIMDLFNQAIMGPTQAAGNQQIGNIWDQMQLTTAGSDLQSQLAQQEAGFSQQGLGLQQQQLGVREAALAREKNLLPQQYGLQQQGFDLQQAQDIYGAGESRRALDSSATSRGAFQSTGTNQGRADIQQQLQYSLQGLGIQRQQASLTNQEQMAQLQDSSKMLGISSQQLGLSGQEIKARLQNALDQIGISNQMTTDQLLQEMYKVQQGEISPVSGLFGDIYALSGVSMPSSSSSDKQKVSGNQ